MLLYKIYCYLQVSGQYSKHLLAAALGLVGQLSVGLSATTVINWRYLCIMCICPEKYGCEIKMNILLCSLRPSDLSSDDKTGVDATFVCFLQGWVWDDTLHFPNTELSVDL